MLSLRAGAVRALSCGARTAATTHCCCWRFQVACAEQRQQAAISFPDLGRRPRARAPELPEQCAVSEVLSTPWPYACPAAAADWPRCRRRWRESQPGQDALAIVLPSHSAHSNGSTGSRLVSRSRSSSDLATTTERTSRSKGHY